MMSPLLPLAAILSQSLYSGPQPEDIAVYQNWITGCDNMRNCAAVALQASTIGTDGNTDHLEAMVEIPLATHIAPTVVFRSPATLRHRPDLRIFVDQLEVPLSSAGIGHFKIARAEARRIVQSMRKGQWVYLRDVNGEAIARTSLAGLTAALLRIDEQQGKDDTPDAIVRRGKRIAYDDLPGYSVSLSRTALSTSPPTEPKSKALDDNREQCGSDVPEETLKPSFIRLDSDNSLAIVPWACGSGAYVRYSNIIIISNKGEIRPAEFDYDNGITGDGPSNVQAEVVWLEKERVLESATRFRAIGDCGRTDRYIWDGYKFRLSEQLLMPECRGSFDRIRVWKTEVADR